MSRYTVKDVRGLLERLKVVAGEMGIDAENWTVEQGSPTYGRAWRLYRRDPQNGALHDIFGDNGYLGWSAQEAYNALNTMIKTLYLFRRYPKEEGKPQRPRIFHIEDDDSITDIETDIRYHNPKPYKQD